MTNLFDTTLQSAMEAAQAGDDEKSITLLQQAMALQPASAIPYFLLGANYAQAGMNDEAEAAFIACLARAPDFAIARFQLGLLQLIGGRAVTAQASWESLLGLPNDNYLNCFVRGFLEILRGNKDAAQNLIQAGMAANRENPQLNSDMQGVLERLANLPSAEMRSGHTAIVQETNYAAPDNAGQHYLISTYGKE